MSVAVAVIGVGNAEGGDDGAGLEAARLVSEDRGLRVHAYDGEAIGLLDLWDGAEAVVVIDAAWSGAPPATIHRIDASVHEVPITLGRASSHAIGVLEAIELARALDRLPPRVILYGIEGARFDTGTGLSEEVASALEGLACAVRGEALALASGTSRDLGVAHPRCAAPAPVVE